MTRSGIEAALLPVLNMIRGHQEGEVLLAMHLLQQAPVITRAKSYAHHRRVLRRCRMSCSSGKLQLQGLSKMAVSRSCPR